MTDDRSGVEFVIAPEPEPETDGAPADDDRPRRPALSRRVLMWAAAGLLVVVLVISVALRPTARQPNAAPTPAPTPTAAPTGAQPVPTPSHYPQITNLDDLIQEPVVQPCGLGLHDGATERFPSVCRTAATLPVPVLAAIAERLPAARLQHSTTQTLTRSTDPQAVLGLWSRSAVWTRGTDRLEVVAQRAAVSGPLVTDQLVHPRKGIGLAVRAQGLVGAYLVTVIFTGPSAASPSSAALFGLAHDRRLVATR